MEFCNFKSVMGAELFDWVVTNQIVPVHAYVIGLIYKLRLLNYDDYILFEG